MTAAHRDHRGRFVTDAEHAAGLLLEAAVAEAMRTVQENRATTEVASLNGWSTVLVHAYDRPAVVRMLAEATRSADLLLRGVQ